MTKQEIAEELERHKEFKSRIEELVDLDMGTAIEQLVLTLEEFDDLQA